MNPLEFCFGKSVFSAKNVLIIAEIGTSHGGNLDKAKKLIDVAIQSGANCVKFQHVYADEIIHKNTGIVPLPGGNIRLYDSFKSVETGIDFLEKLKNYAEKQNCLFLCTPFGLKSAKELKSIDVKAIKIASPELNYVQLISQCSSYGLPMILSSGVSKEKDISLAIKTVKESRPLAEKDKEICLMHCVTSYPAPEKDYNVSFLKHIKNDYKLVPGISDHSKDPILVPVLAVSMGAVIIEKHICLSNNDDGLDDKVALRPDNFYKMVQAVREAEKHSQNDNILSLEEKYGKDLVHSTIGNGIKELASSEIANYGRTNRSIHALFDIKKGEIFTKDNCAILRTEKVLRPGLAPAMFDSILGQKSKNDIASGQGITQSDI